MHTLLTALGCTALAGTITLLLGGLALLLRDHLRDRLRQPTVATRTPLLHVGPAAASHAHGARHLELVRHGDGDHDEHDGENAWRFRLAAVEQALDTALICAGYDNGTYTALVLRHNTGPTEPGCRQQRWRIPSPYADNVIAWVEHLLADRADFGSQYYLRIDAQLPQ